MRRTHVFAAAVLALAGLARSQDSRPAPSESEVRATIQDATKLLCGMQENYAEKRGPKSKAEREAASATGPTKEWPYEGVYRVDGLIPPGYRVGGTAICCWALLESRGFDDDTPRRQTFDRGIKFIMDDLERDPLLASGFLGTYDVRGWAHAYGLGILLRARERHVLSADVAKRAETMIRTLVKTLVDTEIPVGGGWNYARSGGKRGSNPSTFMTAPTLQFLFAARKQGFDVPDATVERALKTLEDARLDTGSFQYGTTSRKTGKGIEELPGACARMAICETTLFLAGRSSVDRIRGAVQAFFDGWEWLEKRRKQSGTHEGPYAIAPYFFHYGHTYVAQAIEQLPTSERPPLREKLRALYWKTREPDGGWNDRIFPRSEGYGTAMAILGLLMPQLPAPARWVSKTETASRPAK